MGMEAVETILKAIQGAKGRRAEGEEAAARLEFQREQLKQQKDQNAAELAFREKQHALAVAIGEAQIAAEKQRMAGEEQKVLAGIQKGDPAPSGYKVQAQQRIVNAPPVEQQQTAPSNTAIGSSAPNFPQYSGPGQQLRPQDRRSVTTPSGQESVMLTPQDYATQQGTLSLMNQKPGLDYKAGLDAQTAKTAHDYEVDDATQAYNRSIAKGSVDFMYLKRIHELDNAAALERAKIEAANRWSIAQFNKQGGTEFDPIPIAKKLLNGTHTLEELAALGLKQDERKFVEKIVDDMGGVIPKTKQVEGLRTYGSFIPVLKNYEALYERTLESSNKPAAVVNNMLRNSAETKALAEAVNGAKVSLAAVLAGQGRQVSGSEADAAVNQYTPSLGLFGGSGDPKTVIKFRLDNLKASAKQYLEGLTPGMPDWQRRDIMRGQGIPEQYLFTREDVDKYDPGAYAKQKFGNTGAGTTPTGPAIPAPSIIEPPTPGIRNLQPPPLLTPPPGTTPPTGNQQTAPIPFKPEVKIPRNLRRP